MTKSNNEGRLLVKRWERWEGSILARMQRAHDEGNELAIFDGLLFCYLTGAPIPDWVIDNFLAMGKALASGEKPKRRRGSHANPHIRERDRVADLQCFAKVQEYRKAGLTWEKAWLETARALNVSIATVKKRYSRCKVRVMSGSNYRSTMFDEVLTLALGQTQTLKFKSG